ncbi:hypothetical protein SAMN04488515_0329 [Cognatiyoonia koreensis]|uniref:Uncharacterized protein n=1 Tax=Cognatiyoonia koreensis TaxID=364200 RepID=A0A1I0N071_9RHOB|nr:hypothetical protein SAMN04488515_0329 [Cognatiyoonia koreensis]
MKGQLVASIIVPDLPVLAWSLRATGQDRQFARILLTDRLTDGNSFLT